MTEYKPATDQRLSKAFRKFMVKHGEEQLDTFEVYRAPIDGVSTVLLQLITAGQWNKIKQKGGVDKLFHTFAIINGKYLYEKTALPVLKEGTTSGVASADVEKQSAPVKRMTINEFIATAIKSMGASYFTYDAFNNKSCQDYLYGSLVANGMMNPQIKLFLLQDVEKLVEAHFAQVNTQLRFSGFEVGLLLNFRQWPLKEGGIKRIVHTRA